MTDFVPTARTKAKRLPKRARYDRESVYAILDAGFVCHVGYAIDGQPYVTPTNYWREGDAVYWHGSSASRMLRHLQQGVECCLTVTHVDGLVLARAAFHHSINYRSAMLFGRAHRVDDPGQKLARLEAFVERMVPGRWQDLRAVTEQELKATTVLGMSLEEASAKIRGGPPIDDEEDYVLPIWAGVVPVRAVHGVPADDGRLASGARRPAGLADLSHLGLEPG
ncbi:MAG TPA: pyridoxamine 5'-phosphate oxidase family protein [Burkholderiales bacterium]|nr:pyridoxamine 5'-phosphate oxidase family protein [Burkholderiales bacterium]